MTQFTFDTTHIRQGSEGLITRPEGVNTRDWQNAASIVCRALNAIQPNTTQEVLAELDEVLNARTTPSPPGKTFLEGNPDPESEAFFKAGRGGNLWGMDGPYEGQEWPEGRKVPLGWYIRYNGEPNTITIHQRFDDERW